jgi:meromycolic acid enoyl-[acyl-carrier-protein] reductase
MGVAKASLESITRYLARDLGPHAVRVNTLSAGPLRTIAGKGIPGFQALADGWGGRAPLGWDPTDASPVADTIVFLLSDLSRGITGEMVHVDGGYHAMGSAPAVGSGGAEHASG